jgi:hypothetical protein
VINFIHSAKKEKDQPSTVSNFSLPFEKNHYLQVFVGHLLGSILLKLIPQARLMRVWEKSVGAVRPREFCLSASDTSASTGQLTIGLGRNVLRFRSLRLLAYLK